MDTKRRLLDFFERQLMDKASALVRLFAATPAQKPTLMASPGIRCYPA